MLSIAYWRRRRVRRGSCSFGGCSSGVKDGGWGGGYCLAGRGVLVEVVDGRGGLVGLRGARSAVAQQGGSGDGDGNG